MTFGGFLGGGWSPEGPSHDEKLGTFSSTPPTPPFSWKGRGIRNGVNQLNVPMVKPPLQNQEYSIWRTSGLVNKHIPVPGGRHTPAPRGQKLLSAQGSFWTSPCVPFPFHLAVHLYPSSYPLLNNKLVNVFPGVLLAVLANDWTWGGELEPLLCNWLFRSTGRTWVAVGQPCEPAPASLASDANFGQLVSECLAGVGWGTHRSGVSSVVSVRGKGGL